MTDSHPGRELPSDLHTSPAPDTVVQGDQAPRSGLKNPQRAVRGVAAATLGLEALVVLFALAPMAHLGGGLTAGKLTALLALVVLLLLTAGVLRFRWAYAVGTVLQLAMIACGVMMGAMYFMGVMFLAIWLYVLSLRRTIGVG